MSDLAYAWEKLNAAVDFMAVIDAPPRKRLEECCTSIFIQQQHDIPEEIKERLQMLQDKLTEDKSDPKTGPIPTTIRRMSDTDISECIHEIVSIYDAVTRMSGTSDL